MGIALVTNRGVPRWRAGIGAAACASLVLTLTSISPAGAATENEIVTAVDLDPSTVVSATVTGDPSAVATSSAALAGLPAAGSSYLVLSTGEAGAVAGGTAEEFASTDLSAAAAGADGNDLTQVRLSLRPPESATCVALDFVFLSEEYPEYVGSSYNDIFTAELNDSLFQVEGNQVQAPNNFAYDAEANAVSVNTVFGMAPAAGTVMDGATPLLSAASPVETRADGTMDVILSVQDLGDSIYDSAVIVDNLRWLQGESCREGTVVLTDSDGDGLSDVWETEGIDYDGDGTPELDLPAMGADPQRKDLFLEVDWMERDPTCVWVICWGGRSFAPQQEALDDLRGAFAASPVANPDGSTGIQLHVDSGPGAVMDPASGTSWGARSGSNRVQHQASLGAVVGGDYDWTDFDALKTGNFDFARRDAFHYVVYADTYAGSESSGLSRGIPGGDLIVSDGHSGWGPGFSRLQERGTVMHELGHNLDLHHGGDTDETRRPGYESIMSYAFQLVGLPPDDRLDYSRGAPFIDWEHLRFDGGSIGDLGDSAPPTLTPLLDELTAEEAKETGDYAVDGDGAFTVVGPAVLVPGTGTRSLLLDVTNLGSTEETYTAVTTSASAALTSSQDVTLAAGATRRIEIPVDTGALTPGETEVRVRLDSTRLGEGIATETVAIQVLDPEDPATVAQMTDAVPAITAAEDIDDDMQAQLLEMLQDALTSTTATVTMTGNGALTADFAVAEPQFGGDPQNPTRVTVRSTPGSPQFALDVSGPAKKGTIQLSGTLTVENAAGAAATYEVKGRWDSETASFAGTYHGERNGSVRIVLTAD